jgi:hypothetical protein
MTFGAGFAEHQAKVIPMIEIVAVKGHGWV